MTRVDWALLIAVVACAVAALLLLTTFYLLIQLRRIRRGQKLVLGSDQQDMVEYAVGLLARVEAVEGRAGQVEDGVARIGARIDGCLQRLSLLRYDALDGAGGRQSVSMALLDSAAKGVVLTAIQDREYARIYVKQVVDGQSDVELSPEERQALDQASGS
jgi:hypothetical protein